MRRTHGWIIAAVCGSAISASTQAAPLRTGWVDPQATWVAHIDVEALAASQIAQTVFSESGVSIDDDLADIQRELGIDPRRDVFGVTVFGSGPDDDSAVLVITGSPAIDRAVAKIPDHLPGYQAIREGAHTVHTWTDNDDMHYLYVGPGRADAERVAVIAPTLELLRPNLLRIAGAGDAAGGGIADGVQARPGSFVFFTGSELPGAEDDHQLSVLLANTGSLRADIGEHAGGFFADVSLEAASEQAAADLSQMVLGLKAMARMAGAHDPGAAQFVGLIDGLVVKQNARTVSMSLALKAAQVQSILNELGEEEDDDNEGPDDGAPDDGPAPRN